MKSGRLCKYGTGPMYELSEAAEADIDALLEHSVTQFGLEQTEHYYESLRHCLELLAENPRLGASAEDIRPNYLRFPHKSPVVFYCFIEK